MTFATLLPVRKHLMSEEQVITSLPVVPVKRTVLFPETLVPFTIGRDRSRAAVEAAMNSEEKEIILAAQRDSEQEEPSLEDLYQIGTKAVIKQMGKTLRRPHPRVGPRCGTDGPPEK